MNFRTAVKHVTALASEIFTVAAVAMYIISAIASGETEGLVPTLGGILMILAMSVAIAASSLIFKAGLTNGSALAVHFMTLAVSYYLIFVVCGGHAKNGGMTLAAMTVFLLCYAVFAIVWLILQRIRGKKKNASASYSSMFADKD